MKVLSILQPWASLCVTTDPKTGKAYKQIETRSWNTKYRGSLLIHASKKGMLVWMKELVNKWIFPNNPNLQFTTGAIIGMVNLVETFPFRAVWPSIIKRMGLIMNERYVEFTEQELAFGDYSAGRYGWLLSDPILFKTPIPCKGNLSIWNLPGELEGTVLAEIIHATGKNYEFQDGKLFQVVSQYQPSLIATPGEGAVIVDPIKAAKWDPSGNREFYSAPIDPNKSMWDKFLMK